MVQPETTIWQYTHGVPDETRVSPDGYGLVTCVGAHPDVFAGEAPAGLLRLRPRAVYLLNKLGDSTGLAVLSAAPPAADCERLLGADHPDTLTAPKVIHANLAALVAPGKAQ